MNKDTRKKIEKILDELILSVPSDEFGTAEDGRGCELVFEETVSKINALLLLERKNTLEEIIKKYGTATDDGCGGCMYGNLEEQIKRDFGLI